VAVTRAFGARISTWVLMSKQLSAGTRQSSLCRCNNHCRDHTLPHCDVRQSQDYPRAFANKEDAALFKLTFEADNITENTNV